MADAQVELEVPSAQVPQTAPIELVLAGQPEKDADVDAHYAAADPEDELEMEGDEPDDAPEPPAPHMASPTHHDDDGEIVTPLIVHKDDEEESEPEA